MSRVRPGASTTAASPTVVTWQTSLGRRSLQVSVLGDEEGPAASVHDRSDVVLAAAGSQSAGGQGIVCVDDPVEQLRRLREVTAARPEASGALVDVLSRTPDLPTRDGLALESATFSRLLGGTEFAAWLAARGPVRPAGQPERVALERTGDELTITLARPDRRNAYDAAMRDALLEALEIARLDPDVLVVLRGTGPDFCAGGDLDEFGTAQDLDSAHRLRMKASPAARIDELRDRVSVEIHGHAVGSGIEIAAFAGTVRARTDARFALPEIAMGLIPGAGGTVSLTRRIGRRRMLWWALTGTTIDAATAHDWGLVDDLAH